jgi:glycine/D-amino acid oxidase-like deaminating enzyme
VRTRYGISPWIQQFPDSRRPEFSRAKGDAAADVVIVGGGLTGCAVAQAAAAAGLKTIVLERDRIGQGSAGRGAGLLTTEPGPAFREVMAAHGLRSARRVFESWRRGAIDAAALLRRLKIKCALEPRETIVLAFRDTEKLLRREFDARIAAGQEAAWLSPRQVSKLVRSDAIGAMRIRDGFTLDPYRACLGLAAAAKARGARFFEKSPATKIRFTATHAEVTLAGGVLKAATVVIATGVAGAEFKPLRRHFTPREEYHVLTEAVPAAVRKHMAEDGVVVRDGRIPAQTLRWAEEGRVLVSGAAQAETPARTRKAVLVQRTGQLMYEVLKMYPAISGLQPEYGWEASYGETTDGLMYIGAHRNYPRHLFALGGHSESVTGAFVAARILGRVLQGEPDKGDEVFGWAR